MAASRAPYSRARIMARAWELFRERYAYPRVAFRSIGRHCFADCLKSAWHEAREIVRLAAEGTDRLQASIDRLMTPRHRVGLSTSYREDGFETANRLWQVRLLRDALALAA